MKRVSLFAFFFLAVSCQKDLVISDDHPASMIGSWVSVNSANGQPDTILVLGVDGFYNYSISTKIDSASRDTSYRETGTWKVQYLDGNNNKIFDTAEDGYYYSEVKQSTIAANKGRHDNCHFKFSIVSGSVILEMYAEEGSPLFTFQRKDS